MRTLLMLTTMAMLSAAATATAAGTPARHQAGDPRDLNPVPEAVAAPVRIAALGDSLTSGHLLPRQEAYPAVLERRLQGGGLAATVLNHGVSSDTTGAALRRLDAALADQPQILIVALGANDGLRGVPVAQVRANLEQIIERATAQGAAVLLCGMEALPLYGWQYTVDFHNLFPSLAAKYKLPLVPFLLNGVLGNLDLMTTDGVHPNAAGAQVIAANIWPYLQPMVEAAALSAAAR